MNNSVEISLFGWRIVLLVSCEFLAEFFAYYITKLDNSVKTFFSDFSSRAVIDLDPYVHYTFARMWYRIGTELGLFAIKCPLSELLFYYNVSQEVPKRMILSNERKGASFFGPFVLER